MPAPGRALQRTLLAVVPRRGARPGRTRPGRGAVVRRARGLLLLRDRHPHLPRRRVGVPAVGLRLSEPDRRGPWVRPRLPGLLGRHDRRRRGPSERAHRGTSYVTISVGGNDAGFADVLTECATAGLAQQLHRRGQRRAELHQHHPARRAGHAVRRHPWSRAERSGGGGRLPADLQRRGLQRRHLVLPDRGGPPQRHRRPAQLPDRGPGRRARASGSPTRPRRSWGTPSATTSSGSTDCPGRSSSPTTPTAAARPPATRRR